MLAYVGFFLYLCSRFDIHTVYDGFREGGIKRESGVNPGQSRCCISRSANCANRLRQAQ